MKLPKTETIKTITSRYSCRSFEPDYEIPEQHLKWLGEAIGSGPSAGNLQAFQFYMTADKKTKEEAAVAALSQTWAQDSSLIFLACAYPMASMVKYGQRGHLYSIQDATIAGQNLTLAAHSLGLGSCWIGAFNMATIKRLFKVEEGMEPLSLICIGLPAQHEISTKRTDVRHKKEARQRDVETYHFQEQM